VSAVGQLDAEDHEADDDAREEAEHGTERGETDHHRRARS
jgi:hypothetical protein